MPDENDGIESINDLAKKIDKPPAEIDSSKAILQQPVKNIKKI